MPQKKSNLERLADLIPGFLGGDAVKAKRERKKALEEAAALRARPQKEMDKAKKK